MIIAGKYEVLGELGRGAMGIVYQVQHSGLGALYALKTLPADLARDPQAVARFQQEARLVAALRHPNIVRVTDFEIEGDLHFFVMDYIDGQSLYDLVHRGPLPLDHVLDITMDVGDALKHAHEHEPPIVHRDIKPSNILIERGSHRAVVTDFGIAKALGVDSVVHTQTGFVVGTVKYCAPEQLRGGKIDARADIFALGLVIHEMLTGRHPLSGRDESQIVACALDDSTEYPLTLPSSVPTQLRQVVAHAVAKKRDARYGSMGDLLADVEEIRRAFAAPTRSLPPDPPPQLPPRQARSIAIMAVTIILVGIVTYVASSELRRFVRPSSLDTTSNPQVKPSAAAIAKRAGAGVSGGDSRAAVAVAAPAVRAIGVMDFTASVPDPTIEWIRGVIRTTLSSRLSGAPDCKVFDEEFMDFKAQALVKQGAYSDLRLATMAVAEQLGVTKAILGSYRASGDALHIEAHVVDMQTGVHEPPDDVDGELSRFEDVQQRLATKLMARLNIALPVVPAAGRGDTIDPYKLLLDADGGTAEVSKPAPRKNDTSKPEALSRAILRVPALIRQILPSLSPDPVLADETAADKPRAEILLTLQKYRRAYEQKDLALLAEVYGTLSPEQEAAAKQYFANADHLEVAIDDVDVAVEGNSAAVSYTRRDKFADASTGEEHTLQVRLTKLMVQNDSGWTIAPNVK